MLPNGNLVTAPRLLLDLLRSQNTDKTSGNISEYGLNTAVTTTNWIDERTPSFKIGYDETNQRLTFDGVNKDLGKGNWYRL